MNKSSSALNDALFKIAHLETMPSIWLSQERSKLFQLKEALKKEKQQWAYWRLRNSSRIEVLTEDIMDKLINGIVYFQFLKYLDECEDRKKAFLILKTCDTNFSINNLNQLKSYLF